MSYIGLFNQIDSFDVLTENLSIFLLDNLYYSINEFNSQT